MTFDGDVLNISPGDIAVRDQSDAPGLDDATAVPYAVMAYCVGDVRLLSTNGTFVLTSPYEMARSADCMPARVHMGGTTGTPDIALDGFYGWYQQVHVKHPGAFDAR